MRDTENLNKNLKKNLSDDDSEYRWRESAVDNELVREVMSEKPNQARIRELVGKGADLNSTGTFGESVLMELVGLRGAEALPLELVKFLVELGADVDHTDEEGGNVLYEACLTCRPDLVGYFLKLGADPNIVVGDDQTLLDSVQVDVEMSTLERDRGTGSEDSRAEAAAHSEIFRLLKAAGARTYSER